MLSFKNITLFSSCFSVLSASQRIYTENFLADSQDRKFYHSAFYQGDCHSIRDWLNAGYQPKAVIDKLMGKRGLYRSSSPNRASVDGYNLLPHWDVRGHKQQYTSMALALYQAKKNGTQGFDSLFASCKYLEGKHQIMTKKQNFENFKRSYDRVLLPFQSRELRLAPSAFVLSYGVHIARVDFSTFPPPRPA